MAQTTEILLLQGSLALNIYSWGISSGIFWLAYNQSLQIRAILEALVRAIVPMESGTAFYSKLPT